MAERITKIHFAQFCMRIGAFAGRWGADCLDCLEDVAELEKPETVFRFTDEVRERLQHLDERAGRQPDDARGRSP